MTTTRRRDAAGTRQLLLEAARRRFATDGYAATSVRDIAGEAGVNVALISRYFESKEGLFRACLVGAVDEIKRTVAEDTTLDEIGRAIAEKVAGPHPAKKPYQLLLLLRSSGDETADRIRLEILGSFARRLAAMAGDPDDERLILHAQVVISAGLGIAIMRSAGLQPLASAGEAELAEAIQRMVGALLEVSE
ncbi:MAG: TetR family transcriptional regulator [Actinoplanes sp.]